MHDLLISDDTAKTATHCPKLPIPRDPMRDGVEQWRSGHYAGVLSGTHDANDIYINSLDWYERNNINLSAGVRAIGIDRLSKTVYASGGHLVPYDKLVLATGSLPFMPPIGGLHSDDGALLPGIFAFRTLEDCAQMISHAANVSRAVNFGGGRSVENVRTSRRYRSRSRSKRNGWVDRSKIGL